MRDVWVPAASSLSGAAKRPRQIREHFRELINDHGLRAVIAAVRDNVTDEVYSIMRDAQVPEHVYADRRVDRPFAALVRLHVRISLTDQESDDRYETKRRIYNRWREIQAYDCEPVGRCPDCGMVLWRQRPWQEGCGGTLGNASQGTGTIWHLPQRPAGRRMWEQHARWVPGREVCPSVEQWEAAQRLFDGC